MPARAKLPPGEGKRVPLNMRTTRETREKLEKSAAGSGRSLAQELVSRSGYTRAGGFELYLAASDTEHVFDALLDIGKPLGLQPAGLGARDTYGCWRRSSDAFFSRTCAGRSP